MTWSTLFWEIMCIHFWYEHWAWFNMEHYILCASMYMCIALHCAHQVARPRGSHQFQFQLSLWDFSPGDDQGASGLLPTVCAYSFYVCKIQIRQVCVISLCGPLSQSCIPAFSLQFVCITLLWMQLASDYTKYKFGQYLYSVQVQLLFICIDIFSIQFQLFFLAYYLLSFIAH